MSVCVTYGDGQEKHGKWRLIDSQVRKNSGAVLPSTLDFSVSTSFALATNFEHSKIPSENMACKSLQAEE